MKLYRIITFLLVVFSFVGFYFTISDTARWGDYVSLLCLVVFVSLINEFLFDPSFRKHFSTNTDEISIGKYSIKGGKIIFMILFLAVFLAGVVYPLMKTISFEYFDKDNYTKKNKMAEDVKFIKTEITEIKKFTSNSYIKKSEIPGYLESMSPDNPQAEPIRKLQAQEKGPWGKQSELPKAETLIVTVPGYVEKGKANACEEHYGNKYILRSDTYEGKNAIVHANAYIMPAGNCADKFTYDMQISCEDAELIFTSKILSCGENDVTKWENEAPKDRRLELYATPHNDP